MSVYIRYDCTIFISASSFHLACTPVVFELLGLTLEEFANICLYSVIKGFLEPTASEWQTPLALERAGSLMGKLLAINLDKLFHFAPTFFSQPVWISPFFCVCLSEYQAANCWAHRNVSEVLGLSEPHVFIWDHYSEFKVSLQKKSWLW